MSMKITVNFIFYPVKSRASENEAMKDMYHEKATEQKRELLDLFLLRNRPQPGKMPHETIYIVPHDDFYEPWRGFIRYVV